MQPMDFVDAYVRDLKARGLFRTLQVIQSPQGPRIQINDRTLINMSSNDYLGLANHQEVRAGTIAGAESWGGGAGAVRTIAGTLEPHEALEAEIAEWKGVESTLVLQSGFSSNLGVIPALVGRDDFILSDELNHASIIDGIRLCKAQRLRYKNRDISDLGNCLQKAESARFKLIATDGVFSMDGYYAKLDEICDLAEKNDALVMIDDSHAVGFVGKNGRGTAEYCGVEGRIDIITGTLGKALGGASGGYTSGRKEIISLLRQRSRPYLFSNTLAPSIVAASIKALELIARSSDLRERLNANTHHFRKGLTDLGFDVRPGTHPIVPIMLGDAGLAQRMAASMLSKGVFVIGFFYPVVPQGLARIRTQVSAAHTINDLDIVLEKFADAKKELGI